MNLKETAQIVSTLKEYYPKDFESTDIKSRVNAWHLILKDYDYGQVQNGVIAFVAEDKKGFAPCVGQIVDKIMTTSNIDNKDSMSEMEAWDFVQKALKNSAYNSECEYDKLPDIIKKIVGSPHMLKSWSICSISEINTVIQSNFMRSFKEERAKRAGYKVLPNSVKQSIEHKKSMMLENKNA